MVENGSEPWTDADYEAAFKRQAANPKPELTPERQKHRDDLVKAIHADPEFSEQDPTLLLNNSEGAQTMFDPEDDGTATELKETFNKSFEAKRDQEGTIN